MAAFMANKGSMDGKLLMKEDLWEKFHSEPVAATGWPEGNRSIFTKGGVSKFGLEEIL
jgi:hypothetical protein